MSVYRLPREEMGRNSNAVPSKQNKLTLACRTIGSKTFSAQVLFIMPLQGVDSLKVGVCMEE